MEQTTVERKRKGWIDDSRISLFSRIEASSEHTPQKSSVRIFHQPVKFNVTSRVGSMQNASHMPGI